MGFTQRSRGKQTGLNNIVTNANGLTATAGGAQAGYAMKPGYYRFTTVASAGDSAQLPNCYAGASDVIVTNRGANAMNVFPQTGQFIGAGAVNAPFSVPAGKTCDFHQMANGIWEPNLST